MILVADVGEVVYHREAGEPVGTYLLDDRTACGDDYLGEVIVQGDVCVVDGKRCVAIDDEGGQGGEVEQPTLCRHVVVAVACSDADVCHLEIHRHQVAIQFAVLSLSRCCEEETACRTTLYVAVGKGGRIGEPTVVEDVVGIQIQRAQLEHIARCRDIVLLAIRLVPSLEVSGILIGEVEAESLAIRAEVQFVVVIPAQQLGGVDSQTGRHPEIAHGSAESYLPVGGHLRQEVLALAESF